MRRNGWQSRSTCHAVQPQRAIDPGGGHRNGRKRGNYQKDLFHFCVT